VLYAVRRGRFSLSRPGYRPAGWRFSRLTSSRPRRADLFRRHYPATLSPVAALGRQTRSGLNPHFSTAAPCEEGPP
jgi:hypothetical protein